MKTTLHLAISADGFIAKPDGDSGWVSPVDSALFEERIRAAGCLVVGHRTFEQYRGELYPVPETLNVVLSHAEAVDGASVARSPEDAIVLAQNAGCAGVLIAGGGATSGAFLEAGLVDEIFFSVHPLFLYQGIRPFGDARPDVRLALADTRPLEDGLVELHYRVVR